MNIQHSSSQHNWATPIHVLSLVHKVIGKPDFDPASSAWANARVQAKFFYTEEIDALITPWPDVGSIFLNPPGGKRGRHSQTVLFWIKLMEFRERPCFEHAIFFAFSAEARQTTQGKGVPSLNDFPCCTPAKRISFDDPTGKRGGAPSHSNTIAYIPGRRDVTDRFIEVFSTLGSTR